MATRSATHRHVSELHGDAASPASTCRARTRRTAARAGFGAISQEATASDTKACRVHHWPDTLRPRRYSLSMIVGERAPDFTLYDHTGRRRSLSSLLDRGPVVLFFFPIASSPICTAQACHFRDLSSEFAAVGAQRVGISTDTVDKQSHFAQQRAFDFPLLSDTGGAVAELFGVRRGRLVQLGRTLAMRKGARHGRHARRRGLVARILPVKRTTFVIDTDRTVLKVVSNELRPSVHADQALWYLQNRDQPLDSSPRRRKHRRLESKPRRDEAGQNGEV